MIISISYITYISFSITITTFVYKTLSKNGEVYLSSSVGFVLVVLGAFHLFNMFRVHKFRESGL